MTRRSKTDKHEAGHGEEPAAEPAAEPTVKEPAEAKAPPPRLPIEPQPAERPQKNAGPLAGLTEGRVVHYVLPHPTDKGAVLHRPGIVVRAGEGGVCDLAVFVARKDFPKDKTVGGMLQIADAKFDNESRPLNTWHFPERVD